jgi:regulator of protease activity HflC (stomatin/prohibitin superfamily)
MFFRSCIIAICACFLSACTPVPVAENEQAVLIMKPWFFGHGGVSEESVKTGLIWKAWSTDAVYVWMAPEQKEEAFEDLMTSDGVPLSFDAFIRLQVKDCVPLIRDFGVNWYKYNVKEAFRTAVRNAVRKRGMNETAISSSAIDEIGAEVNEAMKAYIDSIKIPIALVDVIIGKANPPDSVKSQRIETAAQQQRIETEKQKELAETQRQRSETARAIADNAYRNSVGLNTAQFVQLEQLKTLERICANGNCTFISGNGTPLVQVK